MEIKTFPGKEKWENASLAETTLQEILHGMY